MVVFAYFAVPSQVRITLSSCVPASIAIRVSSVYNAMHLHHVLRTLRRASNALVWYCGAGSTARRRSWRAACADSTTTLTPDPASIALRTAPPDYRGTLAPAMAAASLCVSALDASCAPRRSVYFARYVGDMETRNVCDVEWPMLRTRRSSYIAARSAFMRCQAKNSMAWFRKRAKSISAAW